MRWQLDRALAALMRRVLVIGCGGAGKSTLAVSLGELLDAPVHHLDTVFWKPGWVPSGDEEFQGRLKVILEDDAWIMDGNYGGSLPMRIEFADTIIFLDLPTITCLVGALKRLWQYRGRSRPDMTAGNNERINLEFLLWILSYRKKRRPMILKLLEPLRDSRKVFVLESRQEVDLFLDRLGAEAS